MSGLLHGYGVPVQFSLTNGTVNHIVIATLSSASRSDFILNNHCALGMSSQRQSLSLAAQLGFTDRAVDDGIVRTSHSAGRILTVFFHGGCGGMCDGRQILHILSLDGGPVYVEGSGVGGGTLYAAGGGSFDRACDGSGGVLNMACVVGAGALCGAGLTVVRPGVDGIAVGANVCAPFARTSVPQAVGGTVVVGGLSGFAAGAGVGAISIFQLRSSNCAGGCCTFSALVTQRSIRRAGSDCNNASALAAGDSCLAGGGEQATASQKGAVDVQYSILVYDCISVAV